MSGLKYLEELTGSGLKSARYKQGLIDLSANLLEVGGSSQLSIEPDKRWLGVAERAQELGYPIKLVVDNRSNLGKYVKKFGLESTQEKRLCQGRMCDINIYPVTDELDSVINSYFTKLANKE
jgi:hypothetical protein